MSNFIINSATSFPRAFCKRQYSQWLCCPKIKLYHVDRLWKDWRSQVQTVFTQVIYNTASRNWSSNHGGTLLPSLLTGSCCLKVTVSTRVGTYIIWKSEHQIKSGQCPTGRLTDEINLEILSDEGHSSQVTLCCVKLTMKTNWETSVNCRSICLD